MSERRRILLGIFLFIPLLLFGESGKFLIKTGHLGAIHDLVSLENLLFSAGEDGTVRIWDLSDNKPVQAIQVSHLPIMMIAANPVLPQFAVIETDNLTTYRLCVWDWKRNERIYSRRLDELPLFILYSPKGSFILTGKAAWESLTFFDSESGTILPVLPEGFGIVARAFISNTERSLLTYSPSGLIQYWDLEKGSKKAEISTLPEVEQIQFSTNGRFMIGIRNERIVLVDLISGRQLDSLALPGVAALSMEDDKIIAWSRDNNRIFFVRNFGQKLNLSDNSVRAGSKGLSRLNLFGSRWISSYFNGKILVSDFGTPHTVFAENTLITVRAIAVNDSGILLSTGDKLVSIGGKLFSTDPTLSDHQRAATLKVQIETSPLTGDTGVASFNNSTFLLWDSDNQTGELLFYRPGYPVSKLDTGVSASFEFIKSRGSEILTLDRQGTFRLFDAVSGLELFSYSAFGLSSLAFLENEIIAGRTQAIEEATPLLQINTETGETVPLKDSSLLIFALEYDFTAGILYTLGIERRGERLFTVLKSHTGSTMERTETVLAYPGEDHKASFILDPESSRIYTSLGFEGVKILSWGGITMMERTEHIPRELHIQGDLLIALNRDSSLSIWNKRNGMKVLEFYLFQDNNWVAVFGDGSHMNHKSYQSSAGGERYIQQK